MEHDDAVASAVHADLQHQVIARIRQDRTPQKVDLLTNAAGAQVVEDIVVARRDNRMPTSGRITVASYSNSVVVTTTTSGLKRFRLRSRFADSSDHSQKTLRSN